jgi:hypothetical protein
MEKLTVYFFDKLYEKLAVYFFNKLYSIFFK